jgi:two-component system, sensor histidine kinase RegB
MVGGPAAMRRGRHPSLTTVPSVRGYTMIDPVPGSSPEPASVRVDTLVRLRWLAILGQTLAILVVNDGLNFDLPLVPCLAIIALYAWVNIALRVHFRPRQRLEPHRAVWLLGFDIAELTALLFLTGGLQNPFAFLLIGPVLISATILPPRMTLTLAVIAITCATGMVFVHFPLPWSTAEPLQLPAIYMAGDWLAILLACGYISVYATQVTRESRQLADALAATEIVLTREQHLSKLDGLAAAAAHELGTPLSTIALVAKELERELGPSSPHIADVKLLREQAKRCGDILGKLSHLPAPGEAFELMILSALVEEVVAPHRDFGVTIRVVLPELRDNEPVGERNPAVLYGLGNLVENAVDFAREQVEVLADWNTSHVFITISDDGPGFPPEIKGRIGEPYVTSDRPRRLRSDIPGLGLGFFIAKTLLERSGAKLTLENRTYPQRGAVIQMRWSREDFERRGGTPA